MFLEVEGSLCENDCSHNVDHLDKDGVATLQHSDHAAWVLDAIDVCLPHVKNEHHSTVLSRVTATRERRGKLKLQMEFTKQHSELCTVCV